MILSNIDYCLLKYRPSAVLGEQVNLGIIFFLKEEGELKFIFPAALGRLNSLFPGVDINRVKQYLKNFKNTVNTFSKNNVELIKTTSAEKLLGDYLLVPDSNSLFFSEMRTTRYAKLEELLQQYDEKYFSAYYERHDDEKHSDQYLLSRFAKKNEQKSLAKLFKKGVSVANKKGITTKFEYAWQNGHINLIKPLSFDLVHKSSIQEKSVKWYGYLSQLEEVALQKDLIFNFLLAKPANKELAKPFEDAISILEEKKNIVKLIYEDALEAYVADAEATIKPFQEASFFV